MTLRSLTKELVCRVAHGAGLTARAAPRLRGKVLILTYHSFTPGPTGVSDPTHRLPRDLFARQLTFLQRHFEVVRLQEAAARLDEPGATSGRPHAVVTVDDGFEDNHTLMLPVLQDQRVPATVFVATHFIDTGRPPWPTELGERLAARHGVAEALRRKPELAAELAREIPETRFQRLDALAPLDCGESRPLSRPMSWDDLRTLRDGGVEIGSHTVFHSELPKMPTLVVEQELAQSKERIEEKLGAPCRSFAYPNGDWDPRCRNLVAAAGYENALTQDPGLNAPGRDPLALRRLQVNHDESLAVFACRVTGLLRPRAAA